MFRASLASLYLLFVVLSVSCQRQPSWQEYRSPNGDFRVQFPDKPTETTRTSPLSNGDVKYPRVTWAGRGIALDISYSEIPDLRPLGRAEAAEYLEFLRTQTIEINRSELKESSEVMIDGKHGLEFTEIRPGGKIARYRLFLLGTRLLSARAEQDVGIRPAAETIPLAAQFLTSIRFE